MKIMIVDDEEISLSSVARLLKWRGVKDITLCDNGEAAIAKIKQEDFDIVLLDLLMPEVDGFQVLESTKPYKPHTEFIILTAVDDIQTTVKAIRMGAYDYLVKPVDNDLLFLAIQRAFERKSLLLGLSAASKDPDIQAIPEFTDIITQSPKIRSLLSYARIMAKSGNPVMITGESGTGKELMARAIHRSGNLHQGPFIAVNVCAIPETMFESQFFGHVRGAFTGAESSHKGFFEQANGGSLFLDEIGELPPSLQAKLLRVLEEKTFTPLGSNNSVEVDVHLISATNTDIDKACQDGRIRLDLFYRLKSAHIHLPPLRERKGDIPFLAVHFLQQSCQRHNKHLAGFSQEAMAELINREYPGNIRELAQIVEHAVLMADSEAMIMPCHLSGTSSAVESNHTRMLCTLKENDDMHISFVLNQVSGNRKQAANILGITVRQLQRRLAQRKKAGSD